MNNECAIILFCPKSQSFDLLWTISIFPLNFYFRHWFSLSFGFPPQFTRIAVKCYFRWFPFRRSQLSFWRFTLFAFSIIIFPTLQLFPYFCYRWFCCYLHWYWVHFCWHCWSIDCSFCPAFSLWVAQLRSVIAFVWNRRPTFSAFRIRLSNT
jgi:hypothetical protein